MPTSLQHGVLRRAVAVVALAAVASGCVSTRTGRTLDHSYEAATARVRDVPRRSTEGSGNSEVDLAGPLKRDAVVAAAVARSPAVAPTS